MNAQMFAERQANNARHRPKSESLAIRCRSYRPSSSDTSIFPPWILGTLKHGSSPLNNTPHTPRKRGAEIASVENYSLALDLWRITWAEAFIVDNCTANGARKVAARYLGTGILTPDAVNRAMHKLAHLIIHNERAHHYTLNALGNNISRYIDAPKKETASPTPKRVIWGFACNKCGTTAAGFYPEHAQPHQSLQASRLHGVMIPKKENGVTDEYQQ